MNIPNEDGKQPEHLEVPKQQSSACCGPGCGCEAVAKPGNARWVIGALVLAAAGAMVVRGMIRSDKGPTQEANPAATCCPAAQSTCCPK
jgi:MYXO-CTERM domain-containing protein